MKAAVILFLVAAAVAVAVDARDGRCGGDNCARQVTGTRYGLTPLSSRRADCFNFMKTIIVPDAINVTFTVTVTVTVDPGEPASKVKRALEYRAATEAPTAVPAYASSCKGTGKYSSACACWGITPVLTTAHVPTKTQTATVTADFCEDL